MMWWRATSVERDHPPGPHFSALFESCPTTDTSELFAVHFVLPSTTILHHGLVQLQCLPGYAQEAQAGAAFSALSCSVHVPGL